METPSFEEHLDEVIAAYLKSHYNVPFRYISTTPENMLQVMILQALQHISRDLTAIREALAMREVKEWTGVLDEMS